MIRRLGLLGIALLGPGCSTGESPDLVVFAAASLTDVLDAARPGLSALAGPTAFHFGGSGTLANQILRGAPADVFLSASPEPISRLVKAGRIDPAGVRTFAVTDLVVIVPRNTRKPPDGPEDLTRLNRIGIGDPETVPAGAYARLALRRSGIWNRIRPALVPANHVRVVLSHVETGAVEAGIVYATDAAVSGRVRVAFAFDGVHARYQAAVLRSSPRAGRARKFVRFFTTAEGIRILRRHGFRMP